MLLGSSHPTRACLHGCLTYVSYLCVLSLNGDMDNVDEMYNNFVNILQYINKYCIIDPFKRSMSLKWFKLMAILVVRFWYFSPNILQIRTIIDWHVLDKSWETLLLCETFARWRDPGHLDDCSTRLERNQRWFPPREHRFPARSPPLGSDGCKFLCSSDYGSKQDQRPRLAPHPRQQAPHACLGRHPLEQCRSSYDDQSYNRAHMQLAQNRYTQALSRFSA